MALIMVPSPAPAAPVKSGFSWQAWYAKNKTRLAEKRAHRYQHDPQYRAEALKRSRQQRVKPAQPVTDGYTISFAEAAAQLGITVWVLREWRKKDYFPEPHHRDHRLWFTPEQLPALRTLKLFFDQYGVRVTATKKVKLTQIVDLIYANWTP